MTMTTMFLEIQSESIAECLIDARNQLNGASETILDFSAVQRIDSQTLRALEELLDLADDKSTKIALQGVNVDIYKVLKLVRLAPRLSFLNAVNGRTRPASEE
jgi:ABC-type transporter Mla MlaB component